MLQLSGIHGVIFDLDGTLVESSLDFSKMREAIGCPQNVDILHYVEQITCPDQKLKAQNVILDHELQDAKESQILPIGEIMLSQVEKAGLPMAIVTRNCRQATELKLKMNKIAIKLVFTREDAPPKPDPAALLQIADLWALNPENLLYVGDYVYDQQAAENAGMQWFIV